MEHTPGTCGGSTPRFDESRRPSVTTWIGSAGSGRVCRTQAFAATAFAFRDDHRRPCSTPQVIGCIDRKNPTFFTGCANDAGQRPRPVDPATRRLGTCFDHRTGSVRASSRPPWSRLPRRTCQPWSRVKTSFVRGRRFRPSFRSAGERRRAGRGPRLVRDRGVDPSVIRVLYVSIVAIMSIAATLGAKGGWGLLGRPDGLGRGTCECIIR